MISNAPDRTPLTSAELIDHILRELIDLNNETITALKGAGVTTFSDVQNADQATMASLIDTKCLHKTDISKWRLFVMYYQLHDFSTNQVRDLTIDNWESVDFNQIGYNHVHCFPNSDLLHERYLLDV